MSVYGVTDKGFKRKPKSVILQELQDSMKAKFGQDLDVSPESPEGQMVSIIVDATGPLWELAEHCYNAFNPNAATGVTLENLAQINNIKKKKATPTTVEVTFKGPDGINILKGTIVSSNSALTGGKSYKFATDVAGVISGGEVTILAVCDTAGAIQIPIGSMTILDNPIIGVTEVTNTLVGNVGTNDETDAELRARRTLSVALPSVATTDAIVSGLLNIDTVLSAKVYENDTAIDVTVDGVNIPPHAIRSIIQGSETIEEKAAIAKVFFDRKDPGVRTEGAVTMTIQDSQGFDKVFNWDVPTLVPIYITVDTRGTTPIAFPDEGSEIRDAIMTYVTDPVTGYKIGDEVSYARLFTPINSVPDHFVQSLKIGITPNPTETADISILGGSLAVIADPENDIVINLTY